MRGETLFYRIVKCLFAGQYGEVSQHFYDLFVINKASYIVRVEGHHIYNLEHGLLLHQMRCHLSISIIRAQSYCLLSRLGHFSPGAKDAAKHRAEINSQDH